MLILTINGVLRKPLRLLLLMEGIIVSNPAIMELLRCVGLLGVVDASGGRSVNMRLVLSLLTLEQLKLLLVI